MKPSPPAADNGASARVAGGLAALGAYGIWGLSPLAFKAVDGVAPLEILAHRVVWAALLVSVVLGVQGRLRAGLALVTRPGVRGRLALSAALITVNWLVFITAVTTGRTLDASLGYYIFPLVTVLLGRLVLGEHLTRRQTLAVALAALGVGVAVARTGGLPWISLAVAVSFSLYGLVRKTTAVDALTGLALETLLLSPLMLAVFAALETGWLPTPQGGSAFLDGPPARILLLVLLGPLTALPLILFALAARRLRLGTLGLLQYLNPTLQFLVAALVFREAATPGVLVTFACIWAGVALYAWPDRGTAAGRG